LCDFHIRELGNPNISHRYTIECVLPINLFNQQIFVFLWFWYFLLLVWNISGFFIWLSRSLPLKSTNWISRRISLSLNLSKSPSMQEINQQKRILDHFINVYLEPDGLFLVRLISINTNDYVATDLIHKLWIKHLSSYKNKFNNS
jgi:innexin